MCACISSNDLCLHTGAAIEQEGNDRSDIELPGHQADLLQDAVKYGAFIRLYDDHVIVNCVRFQPELNECVDKIHIFSQ